MAAKQPDPRDERKPVSAVVVSYVPLLAQSFMTADATAQETEKCLREIDGCPSGHVDACLWMVEGDAVMPVFVMEQAHAIADHLLMWSEQRPEEWFTLCFCEREGCYAALLFPNIQKSVDRFRLNWLQRYEEFIAPEQCHVIFRYLHFVSGPEHVFQKVRPRIRHPGMLGFLDSSDVDPQKPSDVAPDRIKTLGPFPVCRDGRPFGVDIDGIVNELFRP